MISQDTQSTVTLTARHRGGAIKKHDLCKDQGVFVGTSSNCGLQLDGEGLSEIHCRLEFNEGELWVQDWMSANGTSVNGNAIDGNHKVGSGDVIQIGDYEITLGELSAPASTQNEDLGQNDFAQDNTQTSLDEPATSDDASASYADEPAGFEDGSDADLAEPADQEPAFDEPANDSFAAEEPQMDFSSDFFDIEEEETYDRETVALLQAEIEDLQAQLAQRDAEATHTPAASEHVDRNPEDSDEVLARMQELIDEANRSDERVGILEELLHAAEEANRSEQEERGQLEAWVGDIERRIGQREEEHAAELEALRARLEEANDEQDRLQRQLRQVAASGGGGGAAPKQYEETLEKLQQTNRELQEELGESQKQIRQLEQRAEEQSELSESALREERAKLAKEQAELSRMRFEISSKIKDVEEMPKSENAQDRETAARIQTLRQHLREIHEQEKQEEREAPLTSRLKKLWKRVEY